MFEQLGNRIERAIHALQGRSQITEINIATTAKEIRRALLQADVGYSVANELTKQIKEEALGRKVISSLSPGKLFTAITCEALTRLMGEKEAALDLSGSPNVIVLAGLQGAGKTTFATKLAAHIKKQGIQPLLTSCDVHRPAAREQLKVMAEKAGLSVYAAGEENDPCALAEKSLAYAAAHGYKTVIVDTAGRLSIDAAMMEELVAIRRLLSPQETLLVVDAMTGQDAVRMAEDFRRQIDYTGVVLTKLDGDTRGGAALSLRAVADVPINSFPMGRRWTHWMFFIQTAWRNAYSAWGMSSPWWRVLRKPLTKRRCKVSPRRRSGTPLISWIFWVRFSGSKRWEVLRRYSPWCRA